MEIRMKKSTLFMKFLSQGPGIYNKTVGKAQNIEIVAIFLEGLDLDTCSAKIGFFQCALAVPA
jgi:hypothetical protein